MSGILINILLLFLDIGLGVIVSLGVLKLVATILSIINVIR